MAGQIDEDLKPAGEEVKPPDGLEQAEDFKDEALDRFPAESESDDEFGDLIHVEALADDQFPGNGRRPQPNGALASLAARIALRWGSQATTTAVLKGYGHGNGHRPVSPKFEGAPVGLFEAEYLDEVSLELCRDIDMTSDSKTCSAALLEDYELMEALALAAAKAKSQTEAEGLIAALAPVSIRLNPQAYRALWPALPTLIQGTVGITRLLHSRPATRPLIGVLPAILRSATAQLARYVAHGQPISRALAARVLAKQTGAALHRWRQTQAEARYLARRDEALGRHAYRGAEW